MSLQEHEIWWTPAWDKRSTDLSKNYGVHGMEITFVLRNSDRTKGLTFTLMTNWMLPSVAPYRSSTALPSAVAIHSLAPTDSPQTQSNCQVVGGPCRSDGSYIAGQEMFDILVSEGIDALWAKMADTLTKWSKE